MHRCEILPLQGHFSTGVKYHPCKGTFCSIYMILPLPGDILCIMKLNKAFDCLPALES